MKYTLEVNEDQMNLILIALQELPFRMVAPLLEEIDNQISSQTDKGKVQSPGTKP